MIEKRNGMIEKPYRLGLVVGRFQVLHMGHADMIRQGLQLCDRLCVLLGSSQECGTENNPISYEQRLDMLRAVFPEKEMLMFPLPDAGLGNNELWGQYVLNKCREYTGEMPDLVLSGKEQRREYWFTSKDGIRIAELRIPKAIPVSATAMREALAKDDREGWQRYTPSALWDRYDFLRSAVLASQGNTHTDSI